MKRTLMVIGGGLLQVPVIMAAKKMNHQVIVTDYNPDAIALRYADIPIIMSTRDIEGSVRVARAQNELTPIHGVVTVGTDASMTVAAVANALSLPGIKFDSAEAATNKIKMRTRFKEHNVPSPEFYPVWSLADAKEACKKIGFPVVIKPSDNMGARGVIRIENKSQIADAFKHAKAGSPSGGLVVEAFMTGPELSIDSVVCNGEITFTGIGDRIIEDLPYFIEKGHNMPSSMSKEILDEACRVMTLGIRALGITHGFAKGDIKVTPQGVKIVELAARLSGGFMSTHTFPLATGVDLMKAAVEIVLGFEPSNLEPLYHRISIERSIITEPGIVKRIANIEEARAVPGISDIYIDVKVGDRVKKPTSNVEKAGHIIAVGDTIEEAERAVEECRKIMNLEVSSDYELSMDSIRAAARERFNKTCFVCRECDGMKCASGVPGMGGIGSGEAFKQNFLTLNTIKINTHVINDVKEPETGTTFFGHALSLPVMAAPITGADVNMGGGITEKEYAEAIIDGSMRAGTIGWVGDGALPEMFKIGLSAIDKFSGMGIAIFKPRANNTEIIKRIKEAEKAGVVAVGVDIDAVGFKTLQMKNQQTAPKSLNELKELISSTRLPFIIKGVMDVRDAVAAAEAGAHAIVVSNHGGRVLDQMRGSVEVLPSIVKECQGKIRILVDGGFRTGSDVFKGLALGADAVLMGRPFTIAAVGMQAEGVAFFTGEIEKELKKCMQLTGCASIADINSESVTILMREHSGVYRTYE
jgi:isopentenyl diphosphate isomerase/L-lactate dehydrogenase-like FMN-dependent dehydrogenase/biotin carboxylase